MELFNAIFKYLPEHSIGICIIHGQGIVQSKLKTHLDRSHKELTARTRKEIIVAAATAYSQWAKTEEDVVYPEAILDPIPHLPIFKDGIKCVARRGSVLCGYINRNIERIQGHCRKYHGWENSRKRGRPTQGKQKEIGTMWQEGVWCQKFQPAGTAGKLFEVSQPQEVQEIAHEDREMERAMELAFTKATASLKTAEKETQAQIEADTNRFEFNAWLNRAGWARHLKGFNREWLLTLIRKPERWEMALTKVCWAAQMVIWKAQQASRASVVGMAAMNYINRREVGNDTNEKPFNARQTEKTMIKYSGWWLEIIRYIWRTYELPMARDIEEEDEVQGNRPPY